MKPEEDLRWWQDRMLAADIDDEDLDENPDGLDDTARTTRFGRRGRRVRCPRQAGFAT